MNDSLHSTENEVQDADFNNIILINSIGESDSDEFDYDFDYDPNEMYYALANENN